MAPCTYNLLLCNNHYVSIDHSSINSNIIVSTSRNIRQAS